MNDTYGFPNETGCSRATTGGLLDVVSDACQNLGESPPRLISDTVVCSMSCGSVTICFNAYEDDDGVCLLGCTPQYVLGEDVGVCTATLIIQWNARMPKDTLWRIVGADGARTVGLLHMIPVGEFDVRAAADTMAFMAGQLRWCIAALHHVRGFLEVREKRPDPDDWRVDDDASPF